MPLILPIETNYLLDLHRLDWATRSLHEIRRFPLGITVTEWIQRKEKIEQSGVYVFHNPEGEQTTKIGTAVDFRRRLMTHRNRGLGEWYLRYFLLSKAGMGYDIEANLLASLQRYQVAGEFFRPFAAVEAAIELLGV